MNATVTVACPMCGADWPTRLATEDDLGIVRCGGCGLSYTSPRRLHPQAHYQGTREAVLSKYGAVLRGEAGHNRDPNYRQELAVIARHKPKGRLLDIGTHCGFFLRNARGMGWDLVGIEPAEVSAGLAREYFGLDVRTGTLAEARFGDGSFDVATMVDVFEHVERPLEMLCEVHRVLRDDGVLFVKVPNLTYSLFKNALATRVLRLRGVDIFDAKEHVVHYTLGTLGAMLERAGFRIVEAFVPLPIQDGAAWKCLLRSIGHAVARVHFAASGQMGPLAMDIAVVAAKR
jgi:SAM-dependent methyltransferase